jgi:nucleotide-binding universal stress UspA family protein
MIVAESQDWKGEMHDVIAVGIDGSRPSRAAIRWGVRRAAIIGGSVKLIAVVGPERISQVAEMTSQRAEGSALAVLDRSALLEEETLYARSLDAGVTITTEQLSGNPMWELVDASAAADLIAIGTHKTGFIHGSLFGSSSMHLAAAAHCPVVIVPEANEPQHSREVVAGADDSLGGSAAVRFAAAEAELRGGALTLVRAWSLPESAELLPRCLSREQYLRNESANVLQSALAIAKSAHPHLHVRLRNIQCEPAAALLNASRSACLVVIGSSGTRSEQAILLGTVSHDLLLNIVRPTAIVHPDTASAQGV